jgi:tetratricopeptide (TPR) repeat protein
MRDHQERYHSYLVYESTQRVPLIIRAPGISPARVEEPVTLADVMPTVLDLAGIEQPANLRGISLRPALEGRAAPRRDIYFESLAGSLNYGWAELRGIRHGRWKLIDSPDPELFDIEADPGETVNLASIEVERLEDLQAALSEIGEPLRTESIAEEAHDPMVDPATHELLMSLGYVGSVTGGSSAVGAVHPREVIDMATELLQAQRAVATQAWDYVLQLADYVLQRDPTNKWALSSSVLALIGLDRAREAQDSAAKMLELYPDAEQSYVMMARAYVAQDQPATAYRVLTEGRKAIPGSESLTYLMLVAAFDAGMATVCAQELPAALAEFPQSSRLVVLEARCEANSGDLEAALNTLAEAVALGFNPLEQLKEAEDFEELVAHPRFEELIAARDAAREKRP